MHIAGKDLDSLFLAMDTIVTEDVVDVTVTHPQLYNNKH